MEDKKHLNSGDRNKINFLRSLKISMVCATLFFAGTVLLFLYCKKDLFTSRSDFENNHQANPADFYQKAREQLVTYIVKPGDTFLSIFSGFGIREDNALNCYHSLKSVGFRTLFPGDSIVLTKDPDDNIKKCSLLNKLQHWYSFRSDTNCIRAEKKPIRITKYLCVVKGKIETSLYEDMMKQGVGDAVIAQLTDLFAWDINFFVDPQPGDLYEVIFTKEYNEGRLIGYGSILSAKYVSTTSNSSFYAIGIPDSTGKGYYYYDLNGKSMQKHFLKAPLSFSHISSGFSYKRKHPILGVYRPHLGVDYSAPTGTPVHAASDGFVLFAGYKGGFGKYIQLSHGAAYQTCYGHLSRIMPGMRYGAHVRQGQIIGSVGSTGLSTGPHLDYRMLKGGCFINPLTLKSPPKESIAAALLDEFNRIKLSNLTLLESRFSNSLGCFIIDIIPDKSPQTIASTTTELPKDKKNESPDS